MIHRGPSDAASRPRISIALHWIGDVTSRAAFSAAVAAGVVGFLIGLAAAGFPVSWETAFATISGAVTLVMVFVIQHTQSRQQLATQLKLNELIRSTPQADDLLVHIETAPDEELLEHEREHLEQHTALRSE